MEHLFEVMRPAGASDEIIQSCKEYIEEKNLTHEELIKLLRPLLDLEWPLSQFYEVFAALINIMSYDEINLDDFSNLRPSDPEFELKVLQLIVESKATEITVFRINNGDNPTADPPKLEPQLWTEITNLKKLKKICITKYQIPLQDLPKMCKRLPRLREIEVVIDSSIPVPTDDRNFAQEFRKGLRHLKEIFYLPPNEDELGDETEFFTTLTNFSVKHHPNLFHIYTQGLFIDMSQVCREMKIKSKLRTLRLNSLNMERVSNFHKFPAVNTLWVDWTDWNHDVTDPPREIKLEKFHHFRDLASLTFCNLLSATNLELFLNSVGQKLTFLNLYYTSENEMRINLSLIQRSCQKLESLEIGLAGVDDSDSLASFTSLLELKIQFIPQFSKNVRLSNLLAAPKLESVRLSGFQVTIPELSDTILSIRFKNILENIKNIHLELEAKGMKEGMRKVMKNEGILFIEAVQNLQQEGTEEIEVDFTII